MIFFWVNQVQIPHATVGPDEPHAASTTWPDGVTEKQGLGILDTELEQIQAFLSSELPSHPKLHRGQLKNGLRYLILPNKVPPNRLVLHYDGRYIINDIWAMNSNLFSYIKF